MTTAEEIGRDFVEALEEIGWPIDEPFYKTECPFKRPSNEECINIAVAKLPDDIHYFNEDCNEHLKTRRGLQMLLEDYGKGNGCSADYPVEFAIHQEHLMWGWPLFE